MNKFVIALANLNQGDLVQELVEASSDVEACISHLNWWADEDEKPTTMDEIHDMAVNSDCWISVLELNHERTSRSGSGLQNQVAGFDSQARVQ
jgi:hypothetical protein